MANLSVDDLPSPPSSSELNLDDLPHPPGSSLNASDEAPGQIEAGARGLAQGATLGFADEAMGGIKAAGHKLAGDQQTLIDLYTKYRDLERQKNEAAEKAHPATFMGSQLGGGLATALIPGLGEANLAKTVALGATTGLGASSADLTKGEIAPAITDVALGAGLGAAGHGLGKGISSALNPEARALAGSIQGAKATGVGIGGELTRGETIAAGAKGIGQTAVEEGTLPLTGGPKAIYDNTIQAIDRNENKLTPIFDSAQEKINDNMSEVLNKTGLIGEKVQNQFDQFANRISNRPEQKKLLDPLLPIVEEFSSKLSDAEGDLSALNKLKQGVYKDVQSISKEAYNNPSGELSAKVQLYKQMGGQIRQHIEDLANAADPGAGTQIAQVNGTLGNLYDASEGAWKLLKKSGSGEDKLVTMKDLALAGGGIASGHPLLALAGAAGPAAKLATGNTLGQLGNIASAKANIGLSKILPSSPGLSQGAGQIGKQLLVTPEMEKQVQTIAGTQKEAPLVNDSKNLYLADPETLHGVGQQLLSNPSTSKLGQSLIDAVTSKNNVQRDATLFTILQRPDTRAIVRDLVK